MNTDPPSRGDIEMAFGARYAGPPQVRAPAGDDTVEAVFAYRGEDHWHLVTFGLGSLRHEDGTPGPELTLLTPPAEKLPEWGLALLVGTARTARAAGRPFHAGARLAPGEPVDGGGSGIVAVGIREDPLVVAAPGRPGFLQVVGVTAGEFGVMRKVGTALVLEKLAARDPLLRTDPGRA